MATALPNEFLERLRGIAPDDYDAVVAAMAEDRLTGFRVNTLKADQDSVGVTLERQGIEARSFVGLENAFTVEPGARKRLLESDLVANGSIYVQNIASQVPVVAMDVTREARVLDLCAAPGGKTSQIAALMHNDGHIAAVEISRKRHYKLNNVLKLLGVTNTRTFCRDGTTVWKHRPGYFDKILLDAPCSSDGRFHISDEKTFKYWSVRKIAECVGKQKALIESAVQCLVPGGSLVYSTCSIAPEENEGIVDWCVRKFDVRVEPVRLKVNFGNARAGLTNWEGYAYDPQVVEAMRLLPDRSMHGFFVCRLVRNG